MERFKNLDKYDCYLIYVYVCCYWLINVLFTRVILKVIMQGKVIAVAYTLCTY